MQQWTSPCSGTATPAAPGQPASAPRKCAPRAQRVLEVLEGLNAAALRDEQLGQSCLSHAAAEGCDSDADEEAEGCSPSSVSSDEEEAEQEEGGPRCLWQDLHELHVDMVQVNRG